MYNQQSTGDKSRILKTPIGGDDLPVVCYSVENHPADSRVNIDDSGKVQTLAAEAGGNVPAVAFRQGGFADYVEGEVGTLRAAGGDYVGGDGGLYLVLGVGGSGEGCQTECHGAHHADVQLVG